MDDEVLMMSPSRSPEQPVNGVFIIYQVSPLSSTLASAMASTRSILPAAALTFLWFSAQHAASQTSSPPVTTHTRSKALNSIAHSHDVLHPGQPSLTSSK